MNYWLLKSEPDVYSINDLAREQTTIWDGVRNYQARNFLRQMQPGDLAFFYHSNTKIPGIVGLMRVKRSQINDPTQFEPASPYYDPKASFGFPRWQTVELEYVETFAAVISLDQLRREFQDTELLVVKRGNRLSVMPINTSIAQRLLQMVQKNTHKV